MMAWPKKFKTIHFYGVLAAGFLFSYFYVVTFVLRRDQHNLFYTGNMLAEFGNFIHHGNPASGTIGNVPGSLTALVMGLPLMIYDHVFSPFIFIVLLHFVAWLLFDNSFKKLKLSTTFRFLFLVFFWLNPWRLSEAIVWNPAYMFFFASLHFWTLVNLREKRSFAMSALNVLSVGLAGQLHLSAFLLFLTTVIMWLWKKIRINYWGVIIGIVLVLASLIPFYLELQELGQVPMSEAKKSKHFLGRGIVYVFPFFKALTYWVRMGSSYFSRGVLTYLNFDWMPIAIGRYLLWAVVWGFAGITAWIALVANYKFFRNVSWKPFKVNSNSFLQSYAFSCFGAVVIAAALSPITFVHWHFLVIMPITLFPLIEYILNLQEKKKFQVVAIFVVSFVVTNVLAVIHSERQKWSADPQGIYLKMKEVGRYGPKN